MNYYYFLLIVFFTGLDLALTVTGVTSAAALSVCAFNELLRISKQIENIPTVSSYMSMVLSTIFYTGLLFLLPVLSYLLAKLGIITAAFLRKYRKHAIVGVLILAAV